jgi:CheY-like chemotaxis protein
MPKTILLADDSVTIQKVVGISFANEDVVLLTVDNGDDAIARAREARPDLVLADVLMPGRSGYEVCEAVKSDPELRHIPVLLLSGTFESFDEERARRLGADGHITKPFEAQVLVDTVNDLLARGASPPAPPAETALLEAPPEDEDAEAFDFFDEELSSPASAPAAAPTVVVAAEEEAFGITPEEEGLELESAFDDEIGLGDAEAGVPAAATDPFAAAGGPFAAAAADGTTVAILDEPEVDEVEAPLPFFGEDFDEQSLGRDEQLARPGERPAVESYEQSFDFVDEVEAVGAPRSEPAHEPEPEAAAFGGFDLPEPTGYATPPPVPAAVPETPPQAAPELPASLRHELHDRLEKLAWEAFGDLSERIVREAVERIESVAWEVIPQMAEVLIREEIRRLKGSD